MTVDAVVEGYASLAALVRPADIGPVVIRDPDDDKVLACAIAARAELIVSGDNDLLVLASYQNIPIVKITEALDRIAIRPEG